MVRSYYEKVGIKNKDLINKVKKLKEDDLTQTEIAEVLGISQWAVSRILNRTNKKDEKEK